MKAQTYSKMIEVVKPNALRSFNGMQTLNLIPKMWRWSWGFRGVAIALEADTIDKKNGLDTKILMFTVSGSRHKGFVMICLNGSDLYNTYFFSSVGNLKSQSEDIYFDDLAGVLDTAIETKQFNRQNIEDVVKWIDKK